CSRGAANPARLASGSRMLAGMCSYAGNSVLISSSHDLITARCSFVGAFGASECLLVDQFPRNARLAPDGMAADCQAKGNVRLWSHAGTAVIRPGGRSTPPAN